MSKMKLKNINTSSYMKETGTPFIIDNPQEWFISEFLRTSTTGKKNLSLKQKRVLSR